MALSGTIQDFGVADIFQLIAQQDKTGRLSLSSDDDLVHVDFRNGEIVWAEDAKLPFERALGERLVKAELITSTALRLAFDAQQRTLERLPSILLSSSQIGEETLRAMTELEIYEMLHRLFQWNQGQYEFSAMEVFTEEFGPAPIQVQNLVMNAIRMLDEWPSIRSQLASFHQVAEADPSMTETYAESGGMDEAMLRVSESVPRRLSIQRLVEVSQLSEFEACRALVDLIGSGYVRLTEPAPLLVKASTPWSRTAGLYLLRVLAPLSVTAAAGLFVMQLRWRWEAPLELNAHDASFLSPVRAVERAVLDRAVELYRLEHGRKPTAISELQSAGLYSATDVVPIAPFLKDGSIRFDDPQLSP